MTNKLERKVVELYDEYPFPNLPINKRKDFLNTKIYKIVYSLTKKFLNKKNKIRIIDIGCGTGELDFGLSFQNADIVGIDLNKKSIDIAKERAKLFKVRNVRFIEKNFYEANFDNDFFDFSFSIGTLHHMSNPDLAFKKLVKITKKDGFVVIGLYNPYGRIYTRLKRILIQILAGDSTLERAQLAIKLFGKMNSLPHEKVYLADLYAHPHEKYYSIQDMLDWFKKNNVEFIDCAPPVALGLNLKLLREVFKEFMLCGKICVLDSWMKIIANNHEQKINKMNSFIAQFFWLIIGKGDFVTMIGKKIK